MYVTVCFIIMFSQKNWNHLNGDFEKKLHKHFIWCIAFPLVTKNEWSLTNDIPPNIFITRVWLIATADKKSLMQLNKNTVLTEHFKSTKHTF